MREAFNHPRAFYVLFSVEMWERFGYYGMQALLVLFMIDKLGWDDTVADNTFSAFAALVYAFICLGGQIGDTLLGQKRTMVTGAVLLAIGYGLLGFNSQLYLYPALGIIVAGNALFKANPSALVSRLYPADDPRLDGAFTLYYMAINIGSFAAMLLCPIVQRLYGWNAAFGLCALGMGIALCMYLLFRKDLRAIDSEAGLRRAGFKPWAATIGSGILVAALSTLLLSHITAAHLVLYIAGMAVLAGFGLEMKKAAPHERIKLMVCLVLIAEAVFFFILYQQMPTSLNLFALRNVEHSILGMSVEPASFQALNPMWVMAASPVLAAIYTGLGSKGKDPSLASKFALGMFSCSLGFMVLAVACQWSAGSAAVISGDWMILSYLLQSIGELLISGLGLSMISKLAPKRSMGFMMGAWFMSTALAMVFGGAVASVASIPAGVTDPHATLPLYQSLFLEIGLTTLLAAAVMGFFAPRLTRAVNDATI